MTIQKGTFYILNRLRTIYPEREAANITDWLMEHLTGSKKAERMVYKNSSITDEEEKKLHHYTERLLQHEPIQYVLNEAWFYGMKFFIDKNVLIPRPETEELVEWVIANCQLPIDNLKILDIGTGSGCIAIAIKTKLPHAEVWACDISDTALTVARKNADDLHALVDFVPIDILDRNQWRQLPVFDTIVSNPPYVLEKDKDPMKPNVINYEPHTALFVPDNDSLVFYDAIADFGKDHLHQEGKIFVEINESLGERAIEFFRSKGYVTELKKDMQGKDRMLKAGF